LPKKDYVPSEFQKKTEEKSRATRGPSPTDFDVKNADYAKSLLVSENTEDKYRNSTRTRIETVATHKYLKEMGGTQTFDTLFDVVKHYSNYSIEKEEEIKEHIEKLRKAAYEVTRFAILEGSKTFMKHPMIEKYGEYAINLGI
jgi:hypothetical protein